MSSRQPVLRGVYEEHARTTRYSLPNPWCFGRSAIRCSGVARVDYLCCCPQNAKPCDMIAMRPVSTRMQVVLCINFSSLVAVEFTTHQCLHLVVSMTGKLSDNLINKFVDRRVLSKSPLTYSPSGCETLWSLVLLNIEDSSA